MNMEREPGKAFGEAKDATDRAINGGLVAGVVALTVLVVFVLQNTQKTEIKFLFWSFEFSVWFALVIAIVLTLVVERLGGWVWRRRRRKRAELGR